jgi:hypothetical protein
MSRLIKAAVVLPFACLIPWIAPHAGQPSPAAPTNSPTAKGASDPVERIKEEGLKRSAVMSTLGELTDVIGPRLTGSPGMKRANDWTRGKLAEWGLENAHLESWGPFGRGWSLEQFSAQVVEPQCIPLIAYIRFFKYEPGKLGPIDADRAHYDRSYRVSAAFLAYLTERYDSQMVRKLNAMMRQGEYKEEVFKQLTGKTVQELDEEWRATLRR